MTRTPIFDELYAKYVAGTSARGVVAPSAGAVATTSPEPRHDQFASQYTGRHQTPQWPSDDSQNVSGRG